jgi:hypothetical protein
VCNKNGSYIMFMQWKKKKKEEEEEEREKDVAYN